MVEKVKIKQMAILMLMAAILLSSCGRESELTRTPIRVLYNNVAEAPYNEDWLILEKYSELKNADLDLIIADNEDYVEYIDQAINSKDSPDVILNCWPETAEKYANQGLLLPISDYVDLMPNFQAYSQNNNVEADIEKLKLSDGKYYILPGFQRPIQVQQWIYRKDLFEKHGIKTPETYDELFEGLVILKEFYPESTPISASWGGAHLFSMMGAGYGISAGWSGIRNYDEQKDQWFYTYTSDNYKAMLQYLNKCYEAGLLDPELFTQSNEAFVGKLTDGSAFVGVSWITSGFDNWNELLEENGNVGGTWYPLSVPESTYGMRKLPAVSVFRKGLVIPNSIVENREFEKILEFIDWAVYSDEGIELTYWGVEGITYEHMSDGNVLVESIISPKNTNGDINMNSEYGFNMLFNLNESMSFEDYKKPDNIVDFLNASIQNEETQKEKPVLKLTNNEVMIVESVAEELASIADEYREKFISGELDFEDDWSNYVGLLDDNGAGVIEKVWNDAWQSNE